MVWIKDVCLKKKLREFRECSQNSRNYIGTPNVSVVFVIRKHRGKKNLSSNFELLGMSEFREASRESLLLTGTPSVRNLKM